MNILDQIRKEAAKGLKSVTIEGHVHYLRKLQPEDLWEGFNIALGVVKSTMSNMEDFKNKPASGSVLDVVNDEAEDEATVSKTMSAMEFFGVSNPENKYEEIINVRAVIKFFTIQQALMLVDAEGKQVANSVEDILLLAKYLNGNKAISKDIEEKSREYLNEAKEEVGGN